MFDGLSRQPTILFASLAGASQSGRKTSRHLRLSSLPHFTLNGLCRGLRALWGIKMDFLQLVRFILRHHRWEPLIANERCTEVRFAQLRRRCVQNAHQFAQPTAFRGSPRAAAKSRRVCSLRLNRNSCVGFLNV